MLGHPQHFANVAVASIVDIAAMKLAAIGDRGSRRDFVDLYFIANVEKKIDIGAAFDLYDKKFGVLHQNKLHLLKALVYFDDAEMDHMPEMLKTVSWKEVKAFFQSEAARVSKNLLET
jgi:predicted nucleotidyltransferase component of viral defense system